MSAGLYIGSWILIVCVSLSPRDNSYTDDDIRADRTHLELLGLPYLDNVAITLHIVVLCYAMFQVTHLMHVEDFLESEPTHSTGFTAGLILCIVIALAAILLLGLGTIYLLLLVGSLGPNLQRELSSREKFVRVLLFLGMFAAIPPFVIWIEMICFWILNFVDVAVQGGGMIMLGLVAVGFLEWVRGQLFKAVGISTTWSLWDSPDSMIACGFACTNLVVGCLYCAFAYDSTDTNKPGWTEKLG